MMSLILHYNVAEDVDLKVSKASFCRLTYENPPDCIPICIGYQGGFQPAFQSTNYFKSCPGRKLLMFGYYLSSELE